MTTAGDYSTGEREHVRNAVIAYADYRRRIYNEGSDLSARNIDQAMERMVYEAGITTPGDFGIPELMRWNIVTGENSDSPDFDVEKGVDLILQRKADIQEKKDREQRNVGIKADLEATRRIPGESQLAPGRYEYRDGDFVRVGDAETLRRYHGTVQGEEGVIIDRFTPSPGNERSKNRPSIGVTPAVYSTENIGDALKYGTPGFNRLDDDEYGQLYLLEIHPRTIVDLRKCDDEAAANRAIKMGFDVVECPEFWEQPETIVMDPDIIKIREVYGISDPQKEYYDDDGELIEDEDALDELRAEEHYYERGSSDDRNVEREGEYGYLYGPLYKARDDSPPLAVLNRQQADAKTPPPGDRIGEALNDYSESKSAEKERVGAGLSSGMEYRGMPKQPTYAPRGGRGSMRY